MKVRKSNGRDRAWGVVVGIGACAFAFAVGCEGAAGQDVLGPDPELADTVVSTPTDDQDAAPSSDPSSPTGACQLEAEPNGSKDRANALVTSRCGTLETPSDVEVLTFTLKGSTQSMRVTFEGDITLRVEVRGGATVVMSQTESPPLPFIVGEPYYITVRPATVTSNVDWKVSLHVE